MGGRLGMCSWSVKPQTPQDLARDAAAAGLTGVQVALGPLISGAWTVEETTTALRRAGVRPLSAMLACAGEDYSTLESIRETGGLRSDAHWLANLQAAEKGAEWAQALGVSLVTFHAGFLPERRGDPLRSRLIGRIRQVADRFSARHVKVGLETGQETAENLLGVLDELKHPGVGVNFDPGNMILYDMGDPVAALDTLAPRVVQVHIKDALLTERPGTWGSEVVVGTGDVDWESFFDVVRDRSIDCDFVIEREAGDSRVADIARAREVVEPLIARARSGMTRS